MSDMMDKMELLNDNDLEDITGGNDGKGSGHSSTTYKVNEKTKIRKLPDKTSQTVGHLAKNDKIVDCSDTAITGTDGKKWIWMPYQSKLGKSEGFVLYDDVDNPSGKK
jgi:hypothetical protein